LKRIKIIKECRTNMNNRINSLKNVAFGGMFFSISLIAKWLKERYNIDLEPILGTTSGIAGSFISSEMDKQTVKLLEFTLKTPMH
jgi:drug/metabolite transporter superfamily protein YnfA